MADAAVAHIARRLGETRLAVMRGGVLWAMRMWRDGDGPAAGAVVDARLVERRGAGALAVHGPNRIMLASWPDGACEGADVRVEITRAAWREPGRDRLARGRVAPDLPPKEGPGPDAVARSMGAGSAAAWSDAVEEQWEAAFEAAALGRVAIAGGRLCLQPTAAFLAVDVDGQAPAATDAAIALAGAIRRYGVGGAIVVDFPAAARAERQAAAAAFDAAMAGQPFERTAINGFGMMQIVLPRPGPSVLERAQLDQAGTAAIALLASARNTATPGPVALVAMPAVARWIGARPHLVAALARAIGRPVDVRPDPVAGTGHVAPA